MSDKPEDRSPTTVDHIFGVRIHTVQHDGHLWVVTYCTEAVSTTHHPDCPCVRVDLSKPHPEI